MSRAEPSRDEAHVTLHAFAKGILEVAGVVADDRDPRRLESEAERLLGVERPVEVGALAADELAPRDDDGRVRSAQGAGAIVSRPLVGTLTRAPATRTTTFLGEESVIVSFCRAKRFICPRSRVPRYRALPRGTD